MNERDRKALTRTIPRTPRGFTVISDPWGPDTAPVPDTVHCADYPTHSPVLGPDGNPLKYEPRPPAGFDLRPKRRPK